MTTPLERLDEAVRAFVKETDPDDPGIVTGWVLGFQCVTYTDYPGCDPAMFGSSYALGPGTSGETGIGLADMTRSRVRRALLSYEDDDE